MFFEHRWFYEGRNGWWEYDVRTGQDLEHYFKQGDPSCEMLIAGFLYIIDFQNMFQVKFKIYVKLQKMSGAKFTFKKPKFTRG
jgi:E3 ubiquitin-protein ligase RNF146